MKLLFDLIYNLTSHHLAVHLGWKIITYRYNICTYNTNNTTAIYYIVQHKQNNTIYNNNNIIAIQQNVHFKHCRKCVATGNTVQGVY